MLTELTGVLNAQKRLNEGNQTERDESTRILNY
jgi:hypothetical protein